MIQLVLSLLFFSNFQDTTLVKKEIPVYSTLEEKQFLTVSADYGVMHRIEREMLIFSPDGLGHGFTSLFYDNLNEVVSFEAVVTDPETGKVIQKAKIKDMSDAAIYSTSSVFDDNRHKYFEIKSGVFPVKVRIVSETKSKTNFHFRDWVPVRRYNQKVIESTLEVSFPTSLGMRYKELNLLGERDSAELEATTKITWIERDLPVQSPALKDEDDHKLLLAPVGFAMENYVGKMEDWSGLASWQYELNKGRNELPEEFKSKIRLMVVDVDSPYEKIKILYSYLQKNFRYVSIQLGIGGWQTMNTADVVKYAYGDCKALTFLMQSMLAEVGIPSNYTLVFAGENEDDIEVDFPSNQFNHVILQALDGDQPVWLECTSNSLPAGYLGDFTKNRHVLVANDTGGYLTKTPDYKGLEWNTAKYQSRIEIDGKGNAKITSHQSFQGNFAADLISLKTQLDSRQQRDYFNKNSTVGGLIIEDFSFELDKKDSIPLAEVSYQGWVQKFTQITSKRVILRPFLDKISKDIFEMGSLYSVDEFTITLSESMQPESELKNQVFEEKGIQIYMNHSLNGNELSIKREIRYSADEELDEDAKSELVKKINLNLSKPYVFLKSTLSEK
jgi:hypothetical protein